MAGYQDSLNGRFQTWGMLGWTLLAHGTRQIESTQFLPVYLQPIVQLP